MSTVAQPVPPTLECGRDLLALVEQISEGLPPADPEHQARCSFCQEAIARLKAAFEALRDLAGQAVRTPRGLSARVLEQLRRERHSVLIGAGVGGRDTVSEVIVSQIARRAALGVEAVQHVSVVSESRQDGGVDLDVRVTADLGPSLPDLALRLRDRVSSRIRELVGVEVTRIDVTVDDVTLDEDTAADTRDDGT
ncbi:Asp23/Gls24 family envelope stress response protein [Patulibacter sp.]|uniref:Asp23/Gls24 family envelope stress response protein n=1 Tax=Patulibacter sp. TaxID=1912859 RepID=UPI0027216FA4|nr:Asp23/Gls24 family envelope stress response protein [Patulibacter sp.]MDO9407969.1 Asp23/Gls24 family envelope stress response protein [Patulibacter sp.]